MPGLVVRSLLFVCLLLSYKLFTPSDFLFLLPRHRGNIKIAKSSSRATMTSYVNPGGPEEALHTLLTAPSLGQWPI